jgi:hypothetical protein
MKSTKAKSISKAKSKPVVTAVADMNAAAKPTQAQAKAERRKAAQATAAVAKVELEALTVAAFRAAGFTKVKPRIDVLTPGRWADKGYRPKAGVQPIFVRAPWHSERQIGYPLYHHSQVEPIKA